jgi:hypothetical protein
MQYQKGLEVKKRQYEPDCAHGLNRRLSEIVHYFSYSYQTSKYEPDCLTWCIILVIASLDGTLSVCQRFMVSNVVGL